MNSGILYSKYTYIVFFLIVMPNFGTGDMCKMREEGDVIVSAKSSKIRVVHFAFDEHEL